MVYEVKLVATQYSCRHILYKSLYSPKLLTEGESKATIFTRNNPYICPICRLKITMRRLRNI